MHVNVILAAPIANHPSLVLDGGDGRRSKSMDVVATLLIVEDNSTQQYILKRLCEDFDYQVHVVSSGEAALEAFAMTNYAAILLDLTLPGMDGIECCRRIRQLEKLRGSSSAVPIVAITANQESCKFSCASAGMDDFLTKPFDPEHLRKILLRHVYQSRKPNLKLLQGYRIELENAAE